MIRCPFIEPDPQTFAGGQDITYMLYLSTIAGNVGQAYIGNYFGGTTRVQLNINGRPIAPGSDRNAYDATFNEAQLLRRISDQSWTAPETGNEYRILASDLAQPRGHPFRSTRVNHPLPGLSQPNRRGSSRLLRRGLAQAALAAAQPAIDRRTSPVVCAPPDPL